MRRTLRMTAVGLAAAALCIAVGACGKSSSSSSSSSSGGVKGGPGIAAKTISLGVLTDLSTAPSSSSSRTTATTRRRPSSSTAT